MSQQFEEPEVLATFDRSWKDKHERLQLERGEYNGRPTFSLRVTWRGEDGSWRWAQARPNDKGRYWQAFGIRVHELRALGRALIAAADAADGGEEHRGLPEPRPRVKDTASRQSERERFDRAKASQRPSGAEDADNLPF